MGGAPFTVSLTNRVANGQTVVAGGWSQHLGKRTFLLATPSIQSSGDSSDSKHVQLQSYVVEGSDEMWNQIGWADLRNASRQSTALGSIDADELKGVLATIRNFKGAEILSAPRSVLNDGGTASIQAASSAETGGNTGPETITSVDIMPQITPDGKSIDLQFHSQVRTARFAKKE
jgi:hypothetical protein